MDFVAFCRIFLHFVFFVYTTDSVAVCHSFSCVVEFCVFLLYLLYLVVFCQTVCLSYVADDCFLCVCS